MTVVKLDTRRITNWDSFPNVFAVMFGFPSFYGHNLNACIDCMTCLDDPQASMTSIRVSAGSVVVLQLDHVADFATRCADLYEAIV